MIQKYGGWVCDLSVFFESDDPVWGQGGDVTSQKSTTSIKSNGMGCNLWEDVGVTKIICQTFLRVISVALQVPPHTHEVTDARHNPKKTHRRTASFCL